MRSSFCAYTVAFAAIVSICWSQDVLRRFAGNWSSNNSGASGSIRLNLSTGDDAVKSSTVTFTLGSDEVTTQVRSVRVAEKQLDVSYEFDIQGTRLVSALTGKRNGDDVEGTYRTTTVDGSSDVDAGKFKAHVVQ